MNVQNKDMQKIKHVKQIAWDGDVDQRGVVNADNPAKENQPISRQEISKSQKNGS